MRKKFRLVPQSVRVTFLMFAVSVSLGLRDVQAACDPTLDPCAPKKVLDQWNKSISAGLSAK